ncbi:Nnf1-domain-containing protein [Aspergillus saccharolyticus JOP 1030-1]|uniref:Nnf1-domain-containing protein n=1 Tax=Aspergillus saccharolyticus JOP 1030-1 TaxID=1450539 RepID=A0A318ZDN8_9EURO|nr:Nnf1-domain-containing protein [Aspergillus saccharolyticus JOP 1030-1]PYH42773.1 Nnf1-domain-containing protein [Aspergillus saccharolyticus JOP 1030-1]
MALSESQLRAISATERVCSAISLIGTFIIVISFISSSSFRKPINRLVFYASWGNMMANVATLMSQSGVRLGTTSILCQFQGFLIQWFMPADALWTFAMACNVYLTFFHKYDSKQLERLESRYVLACYGLPFTPAFVYFFIETETRGKIYGAATLWCWVSNSWDFLRIGLFYGPVWMIMCLTIFIYVRTGSVIYNKRQLLNRAGNTDTTNMPAGSTSIQFSKVTEFSITREVVQTMPLPIGEDDDPISTKSLHAFYCPYSVTIQAGNEHEPRESPAEESLRDDHISGNRRPATMTETNSAAWAYSKYAILFFIALLITWVPSTANRVYSLVLPNKSNFALNFMAENTNSAHRINRAPASPSPPPPAPVAFTPGPRVAKLQEIFDKALARTLRANSYANFSSCFPTPAKQVPASLESVWRQLNAKLEESAKAEFEDILTERDAIRQLNELDRLVGEARYRKDHGVGHESVAPHTLPPDELFRAHLLPFMQETRLTLKTKIESVQNENSKLAQRVQAQRENIQNLLSSLESVVADLEGAAAAATQFSCDNNLRQEAAKMDVEVRAQSEI